MKKTVVATNAPAALGPYSHGQIAGNLVFTSGQLPIDTATGAFPEGIQAQTKQSLINVQAVLEAAGAKMSDIVKTTVFIKNMNDFGAMNEVYGTFFAADFPARTCVEVARLPKDALVEIEAIAYVK